MLARAATKDDPDAQFAGHRRTVYPPVRWKVFDAKW
jgi:hypothetical protein